MDEQDRSLRDVGAAEATVAPEALVHELFAAQAVRTPHAVAVMYGRQQLTYAELHRRAQHLARYLRARGALPEALVGLCTERSLEMVVSVLGILAAGAAYLPFDPAYPAARLQRMLEDATPHAVLIQQHLTGRLPHAGVPRIELESIASSLEDAGSTAEAAAPRASPEHLVYVMYTSGSTGTPKGIAMTHRSMVNLIGWHRAQFGSRPGCRVLQFAALSFDVSFQEIFSTLCTGGTLVLIQERLRQDPAALSHCLTAFSIERLFVPPLVLQGLAEHFERSGEVPLGLREIITAGEPLRISRQIRQLFARLPACRLHNHYGPTETHVVTALTLPPNPAEWPTLPSIGHPIANTRIDVLDEACRPVATGDVGEIYIGGAGVARGYYHQPDLTRQRFLPDPFSDEGAARRYRTGDLGRYRADGSLEYLGRNDHQVKLRGYRIELEEIQARLEEHPRVRNAVVLAREDTPGDKRLVAYVTLAPEEPSPARAAPNAEELREHVKRTLPPFMVPSAFVVLRGWPLTPNGKLDRAALPVPGLAALVRAEYAAPQGALEQSLALIWGELLHIERVGRDDNFFELGGHSLVGAKLLAKVAQAFATDIAFHALFEHPTVRHMAELVVQLQEAGRERTEVSPSEYEDGVV